MNVIIIESNGINKVMGEINRQARFAAKYALDVSANKSRDDMEAEAKNKFAVKTNWTGARQRSGFRARNAKMNGDVYYPLKKIGDLTSGAYTGQANTWSKRQQEGGRTKSNITPIYSKAAGKPNKARGGANSRFTTSGAGGVGEVFGRRGRKESRSGLRKAVNKHGMIIGGSKKNEKPSGKGTVIKTKSGGNTIYAFFNFNKKIGDKDRYQLLFIQKPLGMYTKKLTYYEKIHKANGDKLLNNFKNRLKGNMHRSALRLLRK